LRFEFGVKKAIEIIIMDLNGKTIQQLYTQNSKCQIEIDISSVSQGIYCLEATVGEETVVRKFVKN